MGGYVNHATRNVSLIMECEPNVNQCFLTELSKSFNLHSQMQKYAVYRFVNIMQTSLWSSHWLEHAFLLTIIVSSLADAIDLGQYNP